MIFKQASPSIPIYIFDRNALAITIGKVVSVVPSHVDPKVTKMVVDITVAFGEKQQQYTVEDSLNIAYFGNSCITLDRDLVLHEVDVLKSQSEQTLSEIERHKEIVSKCSQLLLDNNPTLKEKKETEERFSSLESKMEKMMEMMSKFMN